MDNFSTIPKDDSIEKETSDVQSYASLSHEDKQKYLEDCATRIAGYINKGLLNSNPRLFNKDNNENYALAVPILIEN